MQYLSTIVPQAQAITATSGIQQTVAQLALPVGEWMVDGELWCSVSAGTPSVSTLVASLSTAAGNPDANPADNLAANVLDVELARSAGATVGWVLPLVSLYVNATAASTIYLGCTATWTAAGTLLLYGKIAARGTPVGPTPGCVYLHTVDGTIEGYVNQARIQYARPNATTGGSTIQIENRVLEVTEAPDIVTGAS